MDDYTPSTKTVRNAYRMAVGSGSPWFEGKNVRISAAFDRWLEEFGKTEQLKERERIIALLGDDAEIWHSENLQADLIALIKGENE